MEHSHVATAAIVENEDSEILMVKEGKEHVKGKWDFPGGGMECSEDIQSSIKREVKEETGYLIEPKEIVGVYMEESARTGNLVVVFVFSSKIVGKGEKDPDNENEIIESRFFEKEKIKKLDLRKENRFDMLNDYIDGEHMPKKNLNETRSL